MYKVVFGDKIYFKLDNFIDSFKNTFIKLYTDTGIYDEKAIINSYIELGDKFNDLIVDKINNTFADEKIFGFSKTNSSYLLKILQVNNFRLFIYYKEDKIIKNRFIEDIEFYKK